MAGKVILLLFFVASCAYGIEDETTGSFLNPLDVRSLPSNDDVPPFSTDLVSYSDAEPKSIATIAVGICTVYEFASSKNVTHEDVANFILQRTPLRFRSKLYDEFINGGTTFVARLANVGCSMYKIKNIISKMWPFNRIHKMAIETVSKGPFAGLKNSEEFEVMHDAIEYIDKHRGEAKLKLIPETMCYVRNMSFNRGVRKEDIIREVEKRMPDAFKKSFIDKVFRFGVKGVARLADVACKVLPVHVEMDVKNLPAPEENNYELMAVDDFDNDVSFYGEDDVQPAGFPLVFGSIAFCELTHELKNRGVNRQKIVDFINRKIPKPFRKALIEKLTKEGVSALAVAANVGCRIVPGHISEEVDVVPALSVRSLGASKEMFCNLLKMGSKMGATKAGISQYIRNKFPTGWRQHLIGRLVEKGIIAVIEISHKLCFSPSEPTPVPQIEDASPGFMFQ